MSDQQGKGSILLKLLILVFLVVLIIVITIPGDIWTEEKQAAKICRDNMTSIYEAHSYYYKLKQEYAPDKENLILTIQNDSSLLKRQQVVAYTVRLRNAMEDFLNSPITKDLYKIASNIKNIEDDLNQNERYFKSQDEEIVSRNILRRAQELKMKLSTFRSGVEFEYYRMVVVRLDSLWQIRRDLPDFSLQTAAYASSRQADEIAKALDKVDFASLDQTWNPLSSELNDFINTINSIKKLKEATTVADRIADFQGKISSAFSEVSQVTPSAGVSEAKDEAQVLHQLYQEFLGNFLITRYYAQHKLSDTDSMLLALNDENFITPLTQLPYIIDLGDSLNIRVEDPTLLEALRSKCLKSAEIGQKLPFMDGFKYYAQTLDSLHSFYLEVKKTYRRNLDVTIKTKELDELIPRIHEVAAFEAYNGLAAYVNRVPVSNSYSEIKDLIGENLIASGSFIQIYEDNFFGKLDTLHIELLGHLNEFESIVSDIRRNTFSFNWAIDQLNTNLSQIKSASSPAVIADLNSIKSDMEELFIYASEGDTRTVFGVFQTEIINHGKVFGRTAQKSWEEIE